MRQINDVQTIQCRGENGLHRSWTQGKLHKFDDMQKMPLYFRSIFGVQTRQPYQMGQGVDEHNRLSLTWRPGNLCEETISEQTSLLESYDVDIYGLYSYNILLQDKIRIKRSRISHISHIVKTTFAQGSFDGVWYSIMISS